MSKRKSMSQSQSKSNFARGDRVKPQNAPPSSPLVMRAGYRI